jgi:hypothetical protein
MIESDPSPIEEHDRRVELAKSGFAWLMYALNLRNAAKQIRSKVEDGGYTLALGELIGAEVDEYADLSFRMLGPMLMLYGMSVECLLKARHVALNPDFDPLAERGKWWNAHDLRDLANKTGCPLHTFNKEALDTLDELSLAIQKGRYPIHSRDPRVGFRWGLFSEDVLDNIFTTLIVEVTCIVVPGSPAADIAEKSG